MSGRGVAVSAAIHLALVIAMVAAGRAATPPRTVDVEIVAPALVVAEAAPVRSGSPGQGSSAGHEGSTAALVPPAAAPPRRSEPVRKLPRARRTAPPTPRPSGDDVVSERTAEPPAPLEEAPAADGDGAASASDGEGAGLLGGGTGGGAGGGTGDGIGDIDRSGPPVPLDPNVPATRFYTEAALRDRVTGDVSLVLAIDPLGRVGRATVRRGLGHGLDEIATGLAMQIRFRPARDRAGRPIAGTVRWRFHFEPP